MKTAAIVCIVCAIFGVAFAGGRKCHQDTPTAPCEDDQPWTLDPSTKTRYCCAVGEKISGQGVVIDDSTWFTCTCSPGDFDLKAGLDAYCREHPSAKICQYN
ncbi:hypothetical protein RRG08_056582 [Elysia crispata]|uniref:Uncharacterized protein n=1 Tax=Elysia crispata TaxID=231223 RepID=A0AAE0Z6J3_9GAST|nr:hypothetical protein RRG08_056582 [Elysia crispata]